MFNRTLSMFSILTFNKRDYISLIDNIEKSKGYLSYIDSKKNQGHHNKRYNRYLELKTALYNFYPNHDYAKNNSIIFPVIEDKSISKDSINEYYKLYGVQDDYFVEYETIDGPGARVTKYTSIPNECKIYDTSLELDEHFERINRQCLSDEFVMRGHRRFTLLPFQPNLEGKNMESYVVANIYEVGIITLQLIIIFEHDKIPEVMDSPPREIKLKSVSFYKKLKEYKINDFWEKEVQKNISPDDILSYYENQLHELSKIPLKSNSKNRQLSWCFGDYELNKRIDHKDFVAQNKKLIACYLNNSVKEIMERHTESHIDSLLKEAEITRNRDFSYYVTPISSVMIFESSAFLEIAKDSLKESESLLKQEEVYEQELISVFNIQGLIAMLEYLRFYELSLIKKFFLTQILDDISQYSYKSLKEFNNLKEDLNFLKLKYDEDVLFYTEGSQKILYEKIIEKTNVENLLFKVESMIGSIRDDISNSREIEIRNNEVWILIISSILTITLGYTGLKAIVYDIFVNLPFIGQFIDQHPLRYTLVIWGLLVILMVWLNIKRLFVNKA
ncbi:hypothetical protein QNH47_13170 [Virgibacillus halodenitrificans]|uniref:hypothetical protein n=1 Tax=Virgibacillus halodenitrificans TaxID=1482 RepID=UPI0024C0B8B4|nr:hypothetical protein [Virgibacillus halodenitrificans]WHX25118.1 hypothetical protein QNH47_13170 [Virgibacillus halodenitrificans]